MPSLYLESGDSVLQSSRHRRRADATARADATDEPSGKLRSTAAIASPLFLFQSPLSRGTGQPEVAQQRLTSTLSPCCREPASPSYVSLHRSWAHVCHLRLSSSPSRVSRGWSLVSRDWLLGEFKTRIAFTRFEPIQRDTSGWRLWGCLLHGRSHSLMIYVLPRSNTPAQIGELNCRSGLEESCSSL